MRSKIYNSSYQIQEINWLKTELDLQDQELTKLIGSRTNKACVG